MGLGKLDSGCLFRTCTVIIQQWQLSVPSSQGPPGILTSTFLLLGSSKGLGLVLDDLGAGPRKHWFALDRVQSGNGGSFLTILVNLSIRWTKSSKLKLWLVKKQQSYLARQGTPGHFCGLDNVHVLALFRYAYEVALSAVYFSKEWVESQQPAPGNTETGPIAASQLLEVKGDFPLSHSSVALRKLFNVAAVYFSYLENKNTRSLISPSLKVISIRKDNSYKAIGMSGM